MMFDAFFEKRKSFAIWQYVFGLLILTITIQLANTYLMYNLNNAIGMILVAFIVSLYFYKGQLHKKFFLALSIWVIMAGFEIIVLNVIGLCFKITAYEIVNIPAYLVLGVVVSKGSAFGVCYAIRVRSNLKQIELGWTYWFIFVVLFSTSILASFMIYWMLYTLDDSTYNSPAMVSSLGLYVTTFLALYLYQRSVRQAQIIHRQEQADHQMRQQLKHLDEIILRQNELRRIRHDINGHFTALKGYLDVEDISNARRYLADLSEEFHAAAPSTPATMPWMPSSAPNSRWPPAKTSPSPQKYAFKGHFPSTHAISASSLATPSTMPSKPATACRSRQKKASIFF